jgi:hypothetical protein
MPILGVTPISKRGFLRQRRIASSPRLPPELVSIYKELAVVER